MSENTVKEAKEKSKGSWLTNFIWAVLGAIIGIVLGYAVFTATLKEAATDAINDIQATEEMQEVGDASDGISTYTFEHTVLTGEDLSNVVSDIEERLTTIKNDNTYLQLQVGEDEYEAYVYNKNNECFAQASDGDYSAAFRNDMKVVKYTSESSALAVGTDIDILSIAINAAKATTKDIKNARLLKMTPSEPSSVSEYRVDLVGDEAVRACYTSLGSNFADSMLANLKGQITDWEPHLIFVYLVDENSKDISMQCYYVADNTEYTNWVLQAYVPISEWALDESWYTIDVNSIDLDKFVEMLDNETIKISKLLDEIIANSEQTSTDDTENTNDTGVNQ